ncbi:MAG: DUF5522 domain-containing protein [Cyclobacteriaceae bacterium]
MKSSHYSYNKPIEGADFYYNQHGLMVFTSHYLLKQADCCHNKCMHCPYLNNKVKPNSWNKKKSHDY